MSPSKRVPSCPVNPVLIRTVLCLGLFYAALTAPAATVTWDASGSNPAAPTDGAGNWSTANANWSNGSTDGVWTNGNGAVFGSGGAGGAVAIGGGVVVANLTINTNYTFNSNPLTLTNNPTVAVNSATAVTFGQTLAGTGFTKEGAGTLILNPSANNTYAGPTIINNGTVQAGGNDTRLYIPGDMVVNSNGTFITTSGGAGLGVIASNATVLLNGGTLLGNVSGKFQFLSKLIVDNNGQVKMHPSAAGNFYFSPTNVDARSGNIFPNRYRSIVTSLYKSTPGSMIISNVANSSGTEGYIVSMNAGTLIFDKTSSTSTRLMINSGLTLGGGTLIFSNGLTTASPTTENPGTVGTILTPGASQVIFTNFGSGGGNCTFSNFTRRAGALLDFYRAGPGSQTTTTPVNNGILGGWATWNKTDWLIGGTLQPYAAYTVTTAPSGWVAANNVSLAANPSANADDTTINSLRLTAAATVTMNATKTLTLSSGGLMVTGSGATTITGGNLAGGAAGGDLIVNQFATADLTIASDLTDNSGTSLTKSGNGKLILTGNDNLTGTNYLNGGVVEVGALNKLASGPLVLNNGTVRYTGGDAPENRSITLNGLGGTYDVVSGTTLTLAGAIRGSGAAIGDLGGLTKIGAGTLTLTASNSFNGPLIVSNGVLNINGTNVYDKATWDAGKVTVFATLGGSGLVSGPVTVKSGGTLSPGAGIGILTLATNLTLEGSTTNLFDIINGAAGDSLVVQGNLTIQPNARIAINVVGATLEPLTNTIITYTGTKSGSFNPVVIIAGGSLDASVSLDESTPGQIKLVAVPQVAITSQPVDAIASTNDPVTFNVSATGSGSLNYQWYFYGDNTNGAATSLTGATGSSYTIAGADGTNSGYYAVVVSNNFNSVISRFALLVVGNVAPVLSGPANQTVIAGNSVTFSTTVLIANPQPAFQWQTNGVNVGGATTTSLTLNNVPFSLDGTTVSVIASNAAAVVTSNATLSVIVTPAITAQPVAVITNAGSTVVFTSGASGYPAPGLQWYKNNLGIAGQTGATLTLANVQGSDIGTYRLIATNAAGTATSTSVKLTVVSTTLAQTAFTPANGATGVGYDTPLYITFNNPIAIINSGKVRIYNAANSATPVDTIDMGSNTVVNSTLNAGLGIFLTNNIQARSLFPGDATAFNYFPVIISNNIAAIYPHSGVLTSNQTYYVTVDTGVIGEPGGAYFTGVSDTNAWRFTTKVAGPANVTNLVVAADGSGDFVTVQGAVDSLPAGGYPHTLINVRNGNYVEIVNVSGKTNITFRGQSRTGTVVGYGNNNNLNPSTGSRMAFKVNANDIAIENLTVVNRTPQGGSQAEALMVNTSAARFIFNNAEVNSLQDTILANVNSSQGYFYNSTIRGNFDYIWGGGNLFLTNCLIYTVPNLYVTNNYNLTASRTDTGTGSGAGNWAAPSGVNQFTKNGISYVCCKLAADPLVTTITMEGANGSVNGQASWINCDIDTNHYVIPPSGILSTYLLWEYANSNVDNTLPVTLGLTVLPPGDPRLLAAEYATNWLNGWVPQLAPNILNNPVSQTVNYGSAATFTVTATGIPDPAYQWIKDGTSVTGATSATLTIPSATATNAGTYSVVVTTSAGSVTSSNATLTVNPPPNSPPVFTAPISGTNFAINVGVNLAVACPATDSDTPAQTLTYALLTGPSGAAVDSGTGNFTWRPTVSQAGLTNSVSVAVTDNGIPNLSATNNFSVTVNALTAPTAGTANYAGGQFSVSISGQVGPDYALQATTNLVGGTWATVAATNSPAAVPFSLTDTNAAAQPVQFYRVVTGPPLP